jgi:CRP-like cAMP-binding protein
MPKETLLALLHKHPFVDEFTEEHIDRLGSLASEVHFETDHVVFREGDEIHDFYLIVRGRVALELEAPGGQLLRVHTLGPGDELGWSAILMGRGKHFQARALQPVDALAFDGLALLEACRQDKAFGYALMYRMLGVVSERLQATRLQLIDTYSPVARRAGA